MYIKSHILVGIFVCSIYAIILVVQSMRPDIPHCSASGDLEVSVVTSLEQLDELRRERTRSDPVIVKLLPNQPPTVNNGQLLASGLLRSGTIRLDQDLQLYSNLGTTIEPRDLVLGARKIILQQPGGSVSVTSVPQESLEFLALTLSPSQGSLPKPKSLGRAVYLAEPGEHGLERVPHTRLTIAVLESHLGKVTAAEAQSAPIARQLIREFASGKRDSTANFTFPDMLPGDSADSPFVNGKIRAVHSSTVRDIAIYEIELTAPEPLRLGQTCQISARESSLSDMDREFINASDIGISGIVVALGESAPEISTGLIERLYSERVLRTRTGVTLPLGLELDNAMPLLV
jgi:hypothetical protein